MFKTKNKVVKPTLLINNELIPLLEKEAKKGWIFYHLSSSSLKFKKGLPQDIKYQLDFNIPSEEYKDILEQQGYEYVDNFKNIYIYKNQNINAEDLQTDEKTRLQALYDFYTLPYPYLWFILEFILFVILYNYLWVLKGPLMLGYFFLTYESFLYFISISTVVFISFIVLIQQLVIQHFIKQELDNKKSNPLFYKICEIILKIATIFCSLLVVILFIDTLLFSPFTLFKVIGITLILLAFQYIMTKRVYRYESVIKRRLIMGITCVIYFLCFYFVNSIVVPEPSTHLSPYMDSQLVESSQSQNFFYASHSWSIPDEDGIDSLQFENVSDCIHESIAKEMMKYEIVYYERETRMPSEEEAWEIVDREGEWDSKDVPYVDYQKALATFQVHKNELVDECYYNEQVIIARKDKRMIVIYPSDNDIDKIIHHYF